MSKRTFPGFAIILIAVIVLLLGGGTLWFLRGRTAGSDRRILARGTVEATEVRLSFKVPGKLAARFVEEGQPVRQGEPIAGLEDADYRIRLDQARAELARSEAFLAELVAGSRKEDIEQARARLDQAQARLDEAIRGSRIQEITDAKQEWERADAAVRSAESVLRQAASDRERFSYLFEQGGISRREWEGYDARFETAKAALDQARAQRESAAQRLSLREEGVRKEQIAQARAGVDEARAVYERVVAGPRAEQIAQARAQLAAAREALHQAEMTLADTRILAPIDGIVVSKSAEPGEFLQPGAIVVTIVDLEHPWVRAYISEPDMGRLRIGQQAFVSIDADPKRQFPARLAYVSDQAEFTPKFVQTAEERVKLVFRIKVVVENPDRMLKPGMPADVVMAPIG